MKVDYSVDWGVGVGVSSEVGIGFGDEVYSGVGDEVGGIVELEFEGKVLSINMSIMNSMWHNCWF